MHTNKEPGKSPVCPDCGAKVEQDFGAIPPTNIFAGRELASPIEGGRLWQCNSCHLAFRWPTLDKAELDALYLGENEETWGGELDERMDWRLAAQWIRAEGADISSVLDVGCFDGGFLGSLGSTYSRYGIEINQEACTLASERGVKLIGADFYSALPSITYDCVTAFDVIEHVHQPARFLERCSKLIKPGGSVLLSTGNFDSPSFRLLGSAYWYCTIAEHISFISPKWVIRIAADLELEVERIVKFSHGKRDILHYTPEFIKNLAYKLNPHFFAWMRQRGIGDKDVKSHADLARHPPVWITAKDHFIIHFRKT